MLRSQEQDVLYTYADYLVNWVDERVELIKGRLFKMSPAPSSDHQWASMVLSSQLYFHLKGKRCRAYSAPFDVVLPQKGSDGMSAKTVVQPDITVVCDSEKIKEKGCFGVPDLIVEIVSKSSSKRDIQDKYRLYEEVGVQEYWIVYPDLEIIEIFSLRDAAYFRANAFTVEDTLQSMLFPDLAISLNEVFPSKGQDNSDDLKV